MDMKVFIQDLEKLRALLKDRILWFMQDSVTQEQLYAKVAEFYQITPDDVSQEQLDSWRNSYDGKQFFDANMTLIGFDYLTSPMRQTIIDSIPTLTLANFDTQWAALIKKIKLSMSYFERVQFWFYNNQTIGIAAIIAIPVVGAGIYASSSRK